MDSGTKWNLAINMPNAPMLWPSSSAMASCNISSINPKINLPPRRRQMVGQMTEPVEVIKPTADTSFFIQAPMMPISTTLDGVVREGLTSQTTAMGSQILSSIQTQQASTTGGTPTTIDLSSATPGAFDEAAATASIGANAFAKSLLKSGTDLKALGMLATGTASPSAYSEIGNIMAKGKMSAQVGGTGVVFSVKKNGEITVSDLDKVSFGILDWINYLVDASFNGMDANGNPTYVVVPDFADTDLERDISLNKNGLTNFKMIGQGCALGTKFDVKQRIADMSNTTPEEQKQKDTTTNPETSTQTSSQDGAESNTPTADPLPNDGTTTNESVSLGSKDKPDIQNPRSLSEATEQGFSNIIKNIREFFVYRFIRDNLKYIEFPYMYYRWFVKKLGIGFCRLIAKTQRLENPPTEKEERLVVSKMNLIFSLLISIFITYNWFFLMFYEYSDLYGTERPITWILDYQYYKDKVPFLHFLFEYVLYPVDCLNWVLLDKIPKFVKWIAPNPNGTLLFFVLYVTVFQMVETYGGCTIDLFYDSLKILINHTLKPWDLLHRYHDGSVYSITAKTYWFLHLQMLSAQIPTFIPSFYEGFKKAAKTAWDKSTSMKAEYDANEAENGDKDKDSNLSGPAKEIMDKIKAGQMTTKQFVDMKPEDKKKFEKEILKRWMKFNRFYMTEYWVMASNVKNPYKFNREKYEEVRAEYKKMLDELKTLMEKYIIPNIKKEGGQPYEGVQLGYSGQCPDKNLNDIDIRELGNKLEPIIRQLQVDFASKISKEEITDRINAWVKYVDYISHCAGNLQDVLNKTEGKQNIKDPKTKEEKIIFVNIGLKEIKKSGNKVKELEVARAMDARNFDEAVKLVKEYREKSASSQESMKGGGMMSFGGDGEQTDEESASKEKKKSYYRRAREGVGSAAAAAGHYAQGSTVFRAATGMAYGAVAWFSSMVIKILRFLITHYFVTIAAMLVALYLILYSFFGMVIFSKLDIFLTMHQIDIFIRKTSGVVKKDDICGIEGECRGTLFERIMRGIYDFLKNILTFAANSVYVVMILLILIYSAITYALEIKSSKEFRNTMIIFDVLAAAVVLISYIVMKFFIKTDEEKAQLVTSELKEHREGYGIGHGMHRQGMYPPGYYPGQSTHGVRPHTKATNGIIGPNISADQAQAKLDAMFGSKGTTPPGGSAATAATSQPIGRQQQQQQSTIDKEKIEKFYKEAHGTVLKQMTGQPSETNRPTTATTPQLIAESGTGTVAESDVKNIEQSSNPKLKKSASIADFRSKQSLSELNKPTSGVNSNESFEKININESQTKPEKMAEAYRKAQLDKFDRQYNPSTLSKIRSSAKRISRSLTPQKYPRAISNPSTWERVKSRATSLKESISPAKPMSIADFNKEIKDAMAKDDYNEAYKTKSKLYSIYDKSQIQKEKEKEKEKEKKKIAANEILTIKNNKARKDKEDQQEAAKKIALQNAYKRAYNRELIQKEEESDSQQQKKIQKEEESDSQQQKKIQKKPITKTDIKQVSPTQPIVQGVNEKEAKIQNNDNPNKGLEMWANNLSLTQPQEQQQFSADQVKLVKAIANSLRNSPTNSRSSSRRSSRPSSRRSSRPSSRRTSQNPTETQTPQHLKEKDLVL